MENPNRFLLAMEKWVILSFVFALVVSGANSATFTFTNRCAYTVWAGTLNSANKPLLAQTGFQLDTGASQTVEVPAGWGGRMWGRTRCTTDTSGKFTCVTGDCGVHIPCNGAGPAPPATIVEFTLGTGGNKDFYDTSLVDGFNLPFSITPLGGTGDCHVSGCSEDVNAVCPPELRLTAPDGSTAGCKSACVAFGTEEYCCRGAYGTPDKCKPTYYSMTFKNACRLAYSYAYDDASSIFTCTGANYLLTFCP